MSSRPPRRGARRLLLGLGLAVGGIILLAVLGLGGFALWLRQADLTQLAARGASEALGRPVSIARLEIAWGDPLGIEIGELRIANAAWGSEPDMIRIGSLAAQIDLGALWRGVLRYERLRLADVRVVLERDADGNGNWKFPGMDPGVDGGGSGGFALVPKDRTQFPTLIDFAGEDARITYRTRSGNILRIELAALAIAAPAEDAPVRITATGAYNGVAAEIAATTESYIALRDAAHPFGMAFTLAGRNTDIAFDGTSMEPLDFEGMRGRLSLDARNLDDILAALQAERKIDLPLSVAGDFTRDGDRWSLAGSKGELAKTGFTGDLGLVEGKAQAPDDFALDLDFAPLDLNPILAAAGFESAATPGWDQTPLYPAALREMMLSADLTTPLLRFGDTRLADFALQGRAAAGTVALKRLGFDFGGGALSLSGDLAARGKTAELSLQARLRKADIAAISRLLGGTGEEIRGRLDGAATLSANGATLGAALAQADGAALLTLAGGDVARSLIEQVSADLRSIFRAEQGRVTVRCLIAALSVKDGLGTLAPLRLETDAAILRGAGTVDLGKKQLDLTIQTERDSTNFFALDLPIRISGPFAALAVNPQLGEESGLPKDGGHAGALGKLPAALRKMAQGNACVG